MHYFAISPVLVSRVWWAHAGAIPRDRIKFTNGWSKHADGASRRMSILGECPEWQRGRTVNPLAYAFAGSSPASPTSFVAKGGCALRPCRVASAANCFRIFCKLLPHGCLKPRHIHATARRSRFIFAAFVLTRVRGTHQSASGHKQDWDAQDG